MADTDAKATAEKEAKAKEAERKKAQELKAAQKTAEMNADGTHLTITSMRSV